MEWIPSVLLFFRFSWVVVIIGVGHCPYIPYKSPVVERKFTAQLHFISLGTEMGTKQSRSKLQNALVPQGVKEAAVVKLLLLFVSGHPFFRMTKC